ncbi:MULTISPECIES: hypothetical protein [Methanoculleus]|jgi:hypothetical protein|uniref:Uncharacterized protein n=1 Tax=Methanoculleus thermophilus TaxID=2200 RepID=A0A1G9A786_9EURY|nr:MULTISPECIES: hypothetical protein [Methanoculleus]NLN08842.1 hypothetical protein [Methanoculleus thermophilus]SDK22485.1 hypothetical protein SAMN04488571_105174 [Methanoculleus thermophilus]HQD25720.1 hypothetical protein [Methanoculleus thermophilus]
MPSVRINDGVLPSGAGVEGGRKKRPDEQQTPTSREPMPEVEKMGSHEKSRIRGPRFAGDESADIFYTGTK